VNEENTILINYLPFFGLDREPFLIPPDREVFYPAPSHRGAEGSLRFGLEQGEGFMILTGEVGTGKTLLLRRLLAGLPTRYETALILSPNLTPQELLQSILHDLGQTSAIELNTGLGMDRLLRQLNDHLAELAEQDRRLVVVIDEAQNLPLESMEQLRLLSNFESDTCKLIQIILVGQPELRERLNQHELRQLRQRIAVVEQLQPLAAEEIIHYLDTRLSWAGGTRLEISRTALTLLQRYSQGIPRLINKAFNRTLLIAYSQQSLTITKAILQEAIASLDESDFPWENRLHPLAPDPQPLTSGLL